MKYASASARLLRITSSKYLERDFHQNRLETRFHLDTAASGDLAADMGGSFGSCMSGIYGCRVP